MTVLQMHDGFIIASKKPNLPPTQPIIFCSSYKEDFSNSPAIYFYCLSGQSFIKTKFSLYENIDYLAPKTEGLLHSWVRIF